MKPRSNPFLRSVLVGISLTIGQAARADMFDIDGTTAGFGVADAGSYDWLGTGFWAATPNDTGTAATATWVSTRSAYFVGLGSGTNYTVRLGATGADNVTIGNLAINLNAATSGALAGAEGNVTIGNTGDAGLLILNTANSVGALGGGTLTINNGVNLNTKTMNFRGGNVVINGVVSGTGASKIAFGGLWGLTSGTLTLANTANTYAGRANSDYIPANFTLAVTKLANGGSNSSIGISTANIGINGGTLKYIGSTGAQSTTLGLHVASSGAFVSADGVTSSDTISISGAPTYSAADAARTITLTGANLGDNTMAFVFNNNGSGVNILTKTGVGRWVVNQANGYTGVTNAQNGTLVAANTAAFGAAGKTVNVGFNTSVGAVEFATDTTANAYLLNVSSGYTGTVIVNRANSGTDMTHTMGTATMGNGTLNIQKGANVSGVGTLELGGITMSAGVSGLSTGTMLNPTSANAFVSGNITRTGASANLLTLDGTSTGNLISGIISGSEVLTKSNVSTWELSNANTFTGKTLVTGGTLKLTNNLAIQSSAFDTSGAGTLDVTTINTPTFGGLTSGTSYVLPANVTSLTLNPGSGTQTYTGDLSRTGGGVGLTLTKTGAGTQILSGTNSYTGLTTVNGGELRITNAAAIGGTDVTVTTGQLALDGGITVSGKSLTTSGSGANYVGGLQSVSGTNTWDGSVTLGADLSRLGARKNATLVISGAIGDGDNTYTAVIRNENQSNTSGGGNATTITELSGVSTYGGNTQLIAGVTRLGVGDNRLPTGTVLQFGGSGANAKFDMNGRNQEVAGLAVMSNTNDTQRDWNANELTNSSGTLSTLTVNTAVDQAFGLTPVFTGSTNYTGIITGKIALVKSGAANLTLSGSNTYTDGTSIKNGSLILTGGNDRLLTTGSVSLGDVATNGKLVLGDATTARNQTLGGLTSTGLGGNVVGAHATNDSLLTLNIASGTNTYSGVLGGGGTNEDKLALTKSGNGTLELTNTSSYTGATTVSAGTLIIDGNISTSSLTTVNGTGILGGSGTVGDLTIDSTGTHNPGNSPGIMNTGDYTMAGTLNLDLNGTTAGTGYDQVKVTGSVTLSGVLAATVGYTPVNGDLLFILLNDGTDAITTTFSGLAQGGTVSFSGFDWKISYNADSTANTFTGTLDGNDVALMAIPEPSAALIGGLGLLALLRRRRTVQG